MSAPINFESTWTKSAVREETKRAREQYIDKLKIKHEKEEKKKEQAHLRGEDTWMLASVTDRLEQEQQSLAKSKKKKKKEKKVKKDKKHKKKKKKKYDSSSSSESEDDAGDGVWAEKSTSKAKPAAIVTKGPTLQRDSWMTEAPMSDFGALPAITKTEFNEQRQKQKDDAMALLEDKKPIVEELGQHDRELNPYWRDGGSGMPEDAPERKKQKTVSLDIAAGDGGASWWRKSYERCVEQAKEEGRSLEEIAAERYGSLKKLESMVASATKTEKKIDSTSRRPPEYLSDHRKSDYSREKYSDNSRSRHMNSGDGKEAGQRSKFMKPGDDGESRLGQSSEGRIRGFIKPGEQPNEDLDKRKMFLRPGEDNSYRSRMKDKYTGGNTPRWKKDKPMSRSRSREHRRRSRSKERRSRSRSREHRSRSRSKERRRRSRSKERRSRSRSRECRRRSRSKERRSRSRSKEHRSRSRSKERSRRSRSKDRRRRSRSKEHRRRSRSTERRRSRSKEHRRRSRSRERGTERKHDRSESRERTRVKYVETKSSGQTREYFQSSGSSSDTCSSSSESSSENEPEEEPPDSPPPAPMILTEQELNELGAKMVRAELMGNEELAGEIKEQIEKCRKVRELHVQGAPMLDGQKKGGKEDEIVVLTRTDRSGNVRPLPTREHDEYGRKRRKEKVATHDAGGSRERYFADDDKRDLKSLVEQERLGTAEDSNYEFIKLAGKAFGSRQGLEDMDESFMEKATSKKSDAFAEMRERSQAIAEHKKVSAAMERCQLCFEKVPKHLIIAIGLKVYLCLPNHRSIAEGHCLIVPMQHSSQSTGLDEDVFEEIQVYRRALNKMYSDHDMDCVFMETCKDLHRLPHMSIECVPLPRGSMAPIYFKTAIMDTETEWAQNKKVVDLSNRNIRKAVPTGFPYFSVDFGLQGGYAHVIEDEKIFPYYFGREIVAGMLDLEPGLWRKPHKEHFEDQRKKVLAFAEWWKPVDWTQKLKSMVDSD